MKREFAVLACKVLHVVNGRIVERVEHRPVRVMARAEGYAMVRRKGCAPFVASEKDLTPGTPG